MPRTSRPVPAKPGARMADPDRELQRDPALASLWSHSLATSLCARYLTGGAGGDPEPASLLGLVHDTGRIAVLAAQTEVERGSRGRNRVAAESLARIFAELHPLLGALLADSRQLVTERADALPFHHTPDAAPVPVRDLAHLLVTADPLARRVTAPPGEAEREPGGAFPCALLEDALEEAREGYAELGKRL